MIEEVEELGSELKLRSLRDRNALDHAEIHLPRSRTARDVSRCVAESSIGGHCKGRRIDPLPNTLASDRRQRNTRHKVRTLAVVLPSGTLADERFTRTFTGKPVRATAVDVTVQEPTMLPDHSSPIQICLVGPNGSS